MLSNGIHIGRRGGVRLTGGGGETPWWLAGGISAGNVVAAYQPKGAASLAASYVNLANPGTNNAAPGVAPTWATGTGWTFNGSTQWLNTGIQGSVAVLDGTLIVRYANAALGGYNVIAGLSTVANTHNKFVAAASDGQLEFGHKSARTKFGTESAAGVLAVTNGRAYQNGVDLGAISIGAWSTSGNTLRIGGTVQPLFYTGDVIAMAVITASLTAGQVAAL